MSTFAISLKHALINLNLSKVIDIISKTLGAHIMKFITLKQFKGNLDYYLFIAETEEIMVSKNDKVVFTIIPTALEKDKLFK